MVKHLEIFFVSAENEVLRTSLDSKNAELALVQTRCMAQEDQITDLHRESAAGASEYSLRISTLEQTLSSTQADKEALEAASAEIRQTYDTYVDSLKAFSARVDRDYQELVRRFN